MSQQLSPEWFQERLGKVTASRVADLMARTKSGWAASRANYMADLIAERLTGQTTENYTNAAMQWGQDHEQEARDAYSFYTEQDIDPAGFVPHPTIEGFGCSPDGLIGTSGLIEIKCPMTKAHIETLTSGEIPSQYELQMQSQLACTGREWVDFVSFDPRLPERLKLFTKKLYRSEPIIEEIEKAVRQFLAELESKIAALEDLHGEKEVIGAKVS